MVELLFVRHGQTDWNIEGRLQGIKDIPLNSKGISEAEILSSHIGEGYTQIISSPLKRAYKTAEIINSSLNLGIQSDDRLMERDFGELAGEKACFVKTMENISDGHGVESIDDFTNKLLGFLSDCTKLDHGRYLIVTHGGVIISLLSHFSLGELNWENTPIKNCTITGFSYREKWNIDFFNKESLGNNLYNCCRI